MIVVSLCEADAATTEHTHTSEWSVSGAIFCFVDKNKPAFGQ